MKPGLALLSLLCLFTAACLSTTNYVVVQADIATAEGGSVLERVDRLYYLDFLFDVKGGDADPSPQFRKYFEEDFSAFIGKKIVPLQIERWEKLRADLAAIPAFDFAAPAFFQEILAARPGAVVLTGRCRGEIKQTSVIREIHDDKGKRNAFVPQQAWSIEIAAYLIDAATGKSILSRDSRDKATVEGGITSRFQYERILERLSDRLQIDFAARPKKEERFLLLR